MMVLFAGRPKIWMLAALAYGAAAPSAFLSFGFEGDPLGPRQCGW